MKIIPKYEIDNNYLTISELKRKILLYKNLDLIESGNVYNYCCICTRSIYSWFHGTGCVCSNECRVVSDYIFGNKGNSNDKKIMKKLRKELWRTNY